MEECKTAAIVGEPPLEIIPSSNLMYGFISDELFQNESRRFPTNAFELQEATIEPGLKQVQHIIIDNLKLRMAGQETAKVLTHGDDIWRAIRRHVQHPEEFLTRRFSGRFH